MRQTVRGFTIIELSLVLVIIGITSSIAIPGFMGLKNHAKVAEGVMHFQAIKRLADGYYNERNEYPPSGARNPDFDPGQPEPFDPSAPGWKELGYAIGGSTDVKAKDARMVFRYTFTSALDVSTGKREDIVLTMSGDINLDGAAATYYESWHGKSPLTCPVQVGDMGEGRYLPPWGACP